MNLMDGGLFEKFGKVRSTLIITGIGLALLALGGLAGWEISNRTHREREEQRRMASRLGGYRFTNPLLECDLARDAIENEMLQPFREQVQARISEWEKRSSVEHVSVYFRELDNGQSFGISEDEKFAPASLVKIPLLMALFKAAENDPRLFSRRLTFYGRRDETKNQFYKPAVSLEQGRSYTYEDLTRAMIISSDNNAYFLLFGHLDPRVQRRVFLDLGLEVPKVRTVHDYVTVNDYAAFFRILFNASYLTHDDSEKALELLSQTDFKKGLTAGLPQGIPVAHKFGEWAPGNDDDIKQLHDCGIIYYPGNPYLLCVMSRGLVYEDLEGVIADISRLMFNEVNRRYHNF